MTNLRRTPGHFFVFLLFSFTCTLTMSMYFRCIASLARTLPQVIRLLACCATTLTVQALAPAAIFSLALVIYTGFTIPTKDMHPWFRWLNYLNPVGYAFEALMINEVRSSHICVCAKSNENLVPRPSNTLHTIRSSRFGLWRCFSGPEDLYSYRSCCWSRLCRWGYLHSCQLQLPR